MASFDCSGIPRCTIDYPLEITPEEISSLAVPINLLLKSNYLIGTNLETEATFDSLFDIAEEIAGVESCGFLLSPENGSGAWELRVSRRMDPLPPPEKMPYLVAPAAITAHFGKAVSMDPEWGSWSGPICDTWSSRSLVAFPVRRDRDVIGALVFGKRDSHPFSPVQVKLLWALAMQAEWHLHRIDPVRTLFFYSFLDTLTHLYNRRYFDNQLEKEILRSRRTGKAFTLLLLDIDGFRAYNDRFHHASGDIALQEFAEILSGSVREVDTVARMGGDEFAVVLPESNAEGASILANRIIERFRRHPLPGADDSRGEHLSASIGVASFPADSFDRADLVSKADRALSVAKSTGGDRVCLHHETLENGTLAAAGPDLPVRKVFDAGRSVVDMDKFLEILLLTGMQGLGAGRGSIVVKDPAGDFSLRAAIGFGRHEEHVHSAGSIRPGAVTSWVVEHQIPLVVSGPDDSPVPSPPRKNGYHSESFLSIPLTHEGRALGALHLTNRKDHQPFTRDDLLAFTPIAAQIAGILDQGMSFRDNVRSFSLSILGSLSNALELRFPFLSGHSSRVHDISVRIGEKMGLSGADLDALRTGALLHDVGIVGIPGNILAKKRRLNDRELEVARKHAFLGAKMLEGVPSLDGARRAILEHHENFDGTGYPHGLREQEIAVTARILHAAEFYDSVVSDRPHRGRMQPAEAMEMIRNGSGTLFDPEVAGHFIEEIPRFLSAPTQDVH
jgi:diguanylate cyclase (GGDEF)-like protein